MGSGTFPTQAAQASIKLPPTLEADKPALILQDPDQCSSTLLGIDFLSSYVLLGKKATSHAFDDMYESAIKGVICILQALPIHLKKNCRLTTKHIDLQFYKHFILV